MVNIGDVYETTDRRRPVRRLRVTYLQPSINDEDPDVVCEVSRKTRNGWTRYKSETFVQSYRLNPKNHYRLVRRWK